MFRSSISGAALGGGIRPISADSNARRATRSGLSNVKRGDRGSAAKGSFAITFRYLLARYLPWASGQNRLLTFRIAITAAVMAFITALAACLIFIQLATFHAAARAAAAAAMGAASANTLSRLEADVAELSSLVRVLSTPLLPTAMTGARRTMQSSSSKPHCMNCHRPIAFMSATTTVAGCRSDASTFSTRRSARS